MQPGGIGAAFGIVALFECLFGLFFVVRSLMLVLCFCCPLCRCCERKLRALVLFRGLEVIGIGFGFGCCGT